ncbi:LysR family transcriptional regulator [Brevundimonas sp.]|jgi:DNA-binding transcriptional LysR family regulator|uniref:LysR family transcriptional regulator n=1 Tax=Brevundimonas sp. TaxID=1871086 RepID=UPI002E0D85D4|nr:LysR family transcriptional regulator [Brevundimonas sp.]
MDVEALTDFLAVADEGGVSAASRRLGRPKQTVSRRVLALEAQLGVRLLDRGARAVRLTPEGRLLHERAGRILGDLDELRRTLSERSETVEGPLRLSAPILMGQTILGRIAAEMLARHPGLRLEIVMADRQVDLVEEGFDAAIRVGHDVSPGVIARKLTEADVILVATPDFVAAHGPVRAPADLATTPCVLLGEAGPRKVWTLAHEAQTATVEVGGRLTASSLKLCLDAALAGAGVASVPAFIARPHLDAGDLVRILPEWRSGRMPIRLVHPSRRLASPRLRAVTAALYEAFAGAGFQA